MKKVYAINGSEDGLVEIVTNKKLAWEAAKQYVTRYKSDVSMLDDANKDCKGTYGRLLKDMKRHGTATLYGGTDTTGVSADVTEFDLNHRR